MSSRHFTPPIDELMPWFKINCTQIGCKSTFTNSSNFNLHLMRHHHVPPIQRAGNDAEFYHCPVENCIYNLNEKGGKHFLNLRYVYQHFRKVHAVKNYKCNNCQKLLLTEKQLQKHQENSCNKIYSCLECNWKYNSMEALLTHGKRKMHKVRLEEMKKIVNKPIPRQSKRSQMAKKRKIINRRRVTQTDIEVKPITSEMPTTTTTTSMYDLLPQEMTSAATQTSLLADFDVESEINNMLRDIETQTERLSENLYDVPVAYDNALQTDEDDLNGAGFMEDMFINSTDTYTQTCDDLFSELGFIDIQTQTYWPDTVNDADSLPLNDIDMLLVSTETQTSFTQCLLDAATCTNDTETATLGATVNGNNSNSGAFHQLHTSQCTQTCDILVDRMIGGGEQTDFMGKKLQYP